MTPIDATNGSRVRLTPWRLSMMAIYFTCGLALATWASRMPAIRDALDISAGAVGLMLLVGGITSILGLSVGAFVLAHFGARRGMLGGILLFSAGVALVGVGAEGMHSYLLVCAGLAMFGLGLGAVDVIMNVEGASLERIVGRSVLPLLHGFFSIGTFTGAGIGLLTAQFGVGLLPHASVVALTITALAAVCTGGIPVVLPDAPTSTVPRSRRERLRDLYSAWREPRVYLLGLTVIGVTFAEGGANDWLALSVVDDHVGTPAMGAAALAVFSLSMATIRITGGRLVDRFGRARTHRALALLTAVGIALVIVAPTMWVVFVGALLWGTGCALGFPIGMSAAADDPARAAARVGAVAAIGYVAFLAGPPLLGLLAQHVGLLGAFVLLVLLAVLSAVTAGAARPELAVGRSKAAASAVSPRRSQPLPDNREGGLTN